jgi:hypothetical protein
MVASAMFLSIALLAFGGVVLIYLGVRTLRNTEGWGVSYVERSVPKMLRLGSVDTHRKILGSSYLATGMIFAAFGLGIVASHL